MVKKICIALVLTGMCVFAFAQAGPKAILSKGDVDSFIKNYEAIQETLEKHSEEFSSLELDFSNMEGKSITDAVKKVRAFPVPAPLRGELAKFGLGNNAFEKCMVIIYSISVVFMEEMFNSMGGAAGNAEIAAVIKNQVDPIKAAIHSNDMKLITSRKDELLPLMGN